MHNYLKKSRILQTFLSWQKKKNSDVYAHVMKYLIDEGKVAIEEIRNPDVVHLLIDVSRIWKISVLYISYKYSNCMQKLKITVQRWN